MASSVPAVQAKYAWTFSRRSLVIRFFLWLYQMNPKSLNFCKFFWGMILSPITLPLRLIILLMTGIVVTLMVVARAFVWVGGAITDTRPFAAAGEVMDRRDRRRRESMLARVMAKARREDEEHLATRICYESYGGVFQGPKPKGPSAPSLFAAFIAKRADKTVAYFQERPQIGKTVDVAMGWVGKFLVRCIFYPLMILVPLSAFAWFAWLFAQHASGVASGFSTAWDASIHGVHVAWGVAALDLGIAIGLMVAFIGMIVLGVWLTGRGEENSDREREPFVLRAVELVLLTPIEKTADGFLWCITMTCRPLVSLGHGLRSVGIFFIIGHHALKSRTCPRIEITED